jgi:hypothetical protein
MNRFAAILSIIVVVLITLTGSVPVLGIILLG